jgi:D-3-phosphoglycerate dehydrogenase
MGKKKILISAPYILPVIDQYQALFDENNSEFTKANVEERLEEADLLPIIAEYDGVVAGDDRFTRKVLEAASKLTVLVKWGTGIDSFDTEAADECGIKVCRTVNAFTEPVSDTVLGYILCFARNLEKMDRQMKAGVWDKIPGRALNESTIGVIGVGATGSGVLRRARAFGATLLGTDVRDVHPAHREALDVSLVALEELLERSDFVSVNCDLNSTSHHLMSKEQFKRMKSSAYMINTARGPIVDENALIAALQEKEIAGAGMDVFEDEPLPKDSPLLKMDNVMTAPHNCNSSPKAWNRVHDSSLSQLFAALK